MSNRDPISASRIVGGNPKNGRKVGDFYPTPPEATIALLDFLNIPTGQTVWEPACGSGNMADVIKDRGYTIIASDLFDRGYGNSGIDFLSCEQEEPFDWIITNPPYSRASEFIYRAWSYRRPFAFLLKSQFYNAASRLKLFEKCPPMYVCPLTWRPDFTGKGGALMDMNWVVWDPKIPYGTIYKPLQKPKG